MNILVTTFGSSWQIIPELFGFTNPEDFPFFEGNKNCQDTREKYSIKPIDEIWIISSEQNDIALQKVSDWVNNYSFKLKTIICKDVSELRTDNEIIAMRSCIYAAVSNASKIVQKKMVFYICRLQAEERL